MQIPNFDVVLRISAPFCYDVTMKSTENHGNYSGSADKGCDPKIVLLSWILHQSMHDSLL